MALSSLLRFLQSKDIVNYDQLATALLFLNGLSFKVLRHIILLIGLIQARKWLHLQIVLFCWWLPLEMTRWDLDPVGVPGDFSLKSEN